MSAPLAERMRPTELNEYIGQDHLIGEQGILRKSLDHGRIASMILWGPPGVGKTTLANLLAKQQKRPFYSLSAINSGVKDVRETIKKAENSGFFGQGSAVVFIDEIHRFSKSQQDSLLGAVERGIITLIGATTENPSFEVISALLSRCQVYVLEALGVDDLKAIIARALKEDTTLSKMDISITEYGSLLKYSGGDARRLLNILELLISQYALTDTIVIHDELVESSLHREGFNYDKGGDQHYDTASAFIKSIRGSDADAAIYYLARMISGGEDPKFICRRMIISAAEDIGLANPNALLLANTCFEVVQKIGLPEGRIPMAQCAVYLAESPKSNRSYAAINKAMDTVRKTGNLPIPLHLRNAPTQLMKDLGYSDGYVYTHDQKPHESYHYLPKEIMNEVFLSPKTKK